MKAKLISLSVPSRQWIEFMEFKLLLLITERPKLLSPFSHFSPILAQCFFPSVFLFALCVGVIRESKKVCGRERMFGFGD